jgi:hypothetical protein
LTPSKKKIIFSVQNNGLPKSIHSPISNTKKKLEVLYTQQQRNVMSDLSRSDVSNIDFSGDLPVEMGALEYLQYMCGLFFDTRRKKIDFIFAKVSLSHV